MSKPLPSLLKMTGCFLSLIFFYACTEHEDPLLAAVDKDVPAHVLSRLEALGFNTTGATIRDGCYLIEGDIMISPESLAEMDEAISVPGPAGEEQYRAYNQVLCFPTRTIYVRGYGLTSTLSTGLDYALVNLNNVNTCLTFQRAYRTPTPDITIYTTVGTGGVSCFPFNGDPCPYVYAGTDITNVQAAEHVICHELLHALGMRHTDWFNRSYSCGTGGTEDVEPYGTVHIPGTPILYDANSIMNSCYSLSTNGELSHYDRIAFQYMY